MVLGIDEYLPEEDRDSGTDYAIFKKYGQRIRKQTDTSYIDMEKEIVDLRTTDLTRCGNGNKTTMVNIHIYGHSLDFTDKDILVRFLKQPSAILHICTQQGIRR